MARIIIWGAGGHAKVVADLARAVGHEVVGHVDADSTRIGEIAEPGGARILYDEPALFETFDAGSESSEALVVAIGSNQTRLDLLHRVQGVRPCPALVHPSAVVSPSCQLGAGTVVMANVVVNAAARVGVGCILNTGCIIEHDSHLGDGVHVSPNATLAGGVSVGALSWVGAGAVVIQQIRIGESVTVGAGAVVIRNVATGLTVAGCPAKPV